MRTVHLATSTLRKLLDQGWLEVLLDIVGPAHACTGIMAEAGQEEKSNDGVSHTQSGTSMVGLDTGLRLSAARGIRPGGQGAYFADLPCSMVPCRSNNSPVPACPSSGVVRSTVVQ